MSDGRPRRGSVVRLAAATFVSVFFLTGCAWTQVGHNDDPLTLEQIAQRARAQGRGWQADMLEDGDITLAEFDEGHRRRLACLDEAGLIYTEPERNLPDGFRWNYLVSWGGMDEKDGMAAASDCNDNVGDLEVAMSTWGDWKTEPGLLVFIVECVTTAGFDISGEVANYRDVWRAAADHGLAREKLSACIGVGMQQLHPDADYALGF